MYWFSIHNSSPFKRTPAMRASCHGRIGVDLKVAASVRPKGNAKEGEHRPVDRPSIRQSASDALNSQV